MKKIVLLVALVLCFYAGFVIWSINQYYIDENNALKPYKESGMEKYRHPKLFVIYWYGRTAVVSGVLLAVICGSLLLLKRHARIKVKVAIFISLTLFASIFVLSSQAVKSVTVNALLFFDEECTDATERENVYLDFFDLEPQCPMTTGALFAKNWNIHLNCLNGYNSFWDSADWQNPIAEDMLQEAIKELGGVYDPTEAPPELPNWVWKPKPYLDGCDYFMAHLLIVVTNQDMDEEGFSVPHWNALIVKIDSFVRMSFLHRHELSHQFYCPHCSVDGCYMDKFWLSLNLVNKWCYGCFNTINNNREKWANQIPLIPHKPLGPSPVFETISRAFWTWTNDPNDDYVRYEFSWGDNSYTTTDWHDSGETVEVYHSWSSTGVYEVKARAQDGDAEWSNWSSSLTVVINPLPPDDGGGGGGGGGGSEIRPRSPPWI